MSQNQQRNPLMFTKEAKFKTELEDSKQGLSKLFSISQDDLNRVFSKFTLPSYDPITKESKSIALAEYLSSKLQEESGTIYFLNRLDGSNKQILLWDCDNLSMKYYNFFLWFNNTYNYHKWSPEQLLTEYYSKTDENKMVLVQKYLKDNN